MAENLIPIAVSSELDVSGDERIHVAKYTRITRPVYTPPLASIYMVATTGTGAGAKLRTYKVVGDTLVSLPDIAGLTTGDGFYGTTHINFAPDGQNFVAAGGQGAPARSVWGFKIADDTLSAVTMPTPPTQIVYQTTFSPDGQHLIVPRGANLSLGIYVYTFDGTSYTAIGQQALATKGLLCNFVDDDYLVVGGLSETDKLHVLERSGDVFTAWDEITTTQIRSQVGATFEVNADRSGFYYPCGTSSDGQYVQWDVGAGADFQFSQEKGNPNSSASSVAVSDVYTCVVQELSPKIVVYDTVTGALLTDTLMNEQTWTSTSDSAISCAFKQDALGVWYLAVSTTGSGTSAFVVFKETSYGVFEEITKPSDVLTGQGNCVRFTTV